MQIIKNLFNIFKEFELIKRIHRKQMRKILRGARRLKETDDPQIINKIKEELTITNLNINFAHVSKYIYGEEAYNIEIIARQYLLARLAGIPLNKSILGHYGSQNLKLIYQLPDVWISLLREKNIHVDRFKSKILFKFFIFKFFLYGIITILSIFTDVFRKNKFKKLSSNRKFVSFIDLVPHCLPRASSGESYDVVNWYLNWEGRIQNLSEIHHNIKVPNRIHRNIILRNSHYIPVLYDLKNQLKYIIWGLTAIIISFVSFFRGRWVNCLLLREAALAKRVVLANKQLIAAEYLFSNSGHTYRPLWTYAAERRGSVITMYNYSVGFLWFKTTCGYPNIEMGFQSMTWSRILIWSIPLAEYTRSVLIDKNVKVVIVPPIYHSDFNISIPPCDKPYISVFDITPARTSFVAVASVNLDYRTFLIGKQFLEDIYEVVISSGYNLMWKRKRSYGPIHNRAYIKFANSFSERPGVICLHPDVSAFRAIKNSIATISMPFTSTALIAKHFSKPTVYYDSTNIICKDDKGSHHIQVISGKSELMDWMKQLDIRK